MAETECLQDDENGSEDSSTASLSSRIQAELESLNIAADSVNRMENELQAAQIKYVIDHDLYVQQLTTLHGRIGAKLIKEAQAYYELSMKLRKVQIEMRKSTERYHRACLARDRACESLKRIENLRPVHSGTETFDPARQDELNRATEEFMAAETEKMRCEMDHGSKMTELQAMQQYVLYLSKNNQKAISKSKQFYDLKEELESKLQVLRQSAEDLALALTCSKQRYRGALEALESISEHVHEQRRQLNVILPPRTPGVGAEISDELADWPSASIDVGSTSPSSSTKPIAARSAAGTSVDAAVVVPRHHQQQASVSVQPAAVDNSVTDGSLSGTDRDVFVVEGAENNVTDKMSELESRPSSDETAPSSSSSSSSGSSAAGCSVAVRTLPKGIYIAKSVSLSASTAAAAAGTSELSQQQSQQQQFPLLQNIFCDKKN